MFVREKTPGEDMRTPVRQSSYHFPAVWKPTFSI